MTTRPKAIYIVRPGAFEVVFGPEQKAKIREYVDIEDRAYTGDEILAKPSLLGDVDFIFGSWGVPPLDEALLAHAPKLKAVFYAAGSVRSFVTDAVWERGILVTSAAKVNALPVAEFCVAAILFSLKCALPNIFNIRKNRAWPEPEARPRCAGGFRSKVGLVSLGAIGMRTLELLKPFDLRLYVYSRSMSEARAKELGVETVSLETIFSECDVVSLHTPLLPETRNMIGQSLLESMKPHATLLNTARGGIIDEQALVQVMKKRPDLTALLDVTEPEPPVPDSPITQTENIYMCPHISGSMHEECYRMSEHALSECMRYLAGEPLLDVVDKEKFEGMA